jgi:hypothetical protein
MLSMTSCPQPTSLRDAPDAILIVCWDGEFVLAGGVAVAACSLFVGCGLLCMLERRRTWVRTVGETKVVVRRFGWWVLCLDAGWVQVVLGLYVLCFLDVGFGGCEGSGLTSL